MGGCSTIGGLVSRDYFQILVLKKLVSIKKNVFYVFMGWFNTSGRTTFLKDQSNADHTWINDICKNIMKSVKLVLMEIHIIWKYNKKYRGWVNKKNVIVWITGNILNSAVNIINIKLK